MAPLERIVAQHRQSWQSEHIPIVYQLSSPCGIKQICWALGIDVHGKTPLCKIAGVPVKCPHANPSPHEGSKHGENGGISRFVEPIILADTIPPHTCYCSSISQIYLKERNLDTLQLSKSISMQKKRVYLWCCVILLVQSFLNFLIVITFGTLSFWLSSSCKRGAESWAPCHPCLQRMVWTLCRSDAWRKNGWINRFRSSNRYPDLDFDLLYVFGLILVYIYIYTHEYCLYVLPMHIVEYYAYMYIYIYIYLPQIQWAFLFVQAGTHCVRFLSRYSDPTRHASEASTVLPCAVLHAQLAGAVGSSCVGPKLSNFLGANPRRKLMFWSFHVKILGQFSISWQQSIFWNGEHVGKDESGKNCSPVNFGNATNPPAFFGGSMLRVYV